MSLLPDVPILDILTKSSSTCLCLDMFGQLHCVCVLAGPRDRHHQGSTKEEGCTSRGEKEGSEACPKEAGPFEEFSRIHFEFFAHHAFVFLCILGWPPGMCKVALDAELSYHVVPEALCSWPCPDASGLAPQDPSLTDEAG